MNNIFYEKLSNSNPQLMREIKGRFKSAKVVLVVTGSLLIQGLVLLSYFTKLPLPNSDNSNPYCYPIATTTRQPEPWLNRDYRSLDCLKDSSGDLLIGWHIWWSHVCYTLSAIAIVALIVGGLFLLIENIAKEQKEGTLNFIRLSPQTGYKIIIGKLLGVPLLVYIGVAAMIPLHGFAAIQGGYFLRDFISFYSVVSLSVLTVYLVGALYAIKGGQQALICGVAMGGLFSSSYLPSLRILFTQNSFVGQTSEAIWWELPLAEKPIYFQSFVIFSLLILNSYLFKIIERAYQKPYATPLTKKQSYSLGIVANLYVFGFLLSSFNPTKSLISHSNSVDILSAYSILLLPVFLTLALSVSPNRQTLQDWARYRQTRVPETGQPRYSLRADLIWGEKSPSVVAVGIHMLMAIMTLVVAIASWDVPDEFSDSNGKLLAILGVFIVGGWLWIYSIVIQWLFLSKLSKQRWVVPLVLGAIIGLPPLVLIVLGHHTSASFHYWLMFGFGSSPFLALNPDLLPIAVSTLLGQVLIITMSLRLFSRQLKRVGQSEFKQLMDRRAIAAQGSTQAS
ncbi:MAG: hypothetical protein HLUCCO16_12280 [Phormidium sp. OSCR]|nr:MAG: hypothetical protein HLUCCO16_12280 [Phormidium sp. OSCR]